MTTGGTFASSDLDIDICVCTYRRDHLADTLRSLSRLVLKPGWHIRVIVADNDEMPGAKGLAETTARECNLELTYVHAPARNISIARNACLDASTAPLLAFIDDDEIADKSWLGALIAEIEKTNADAVLGPVLATYEADAPDWMRKGDFHSTKPVWVNGEIITGYTCNALVNRTAQAVKDLRFRSELGRSGGEDTAYFTAIHNAGGKIGYAPDAIVTETVPANRAALSWLIKRRFRFGQSHGATLLQVANNNPLKRIENIIMASAKMLFSYLCALLNIIRINRMVFWLLRGTMHAGVIARLLGKRELVQY